MSKALKFVASCRLPTEWGEFTMHGFEEEGGQEHVALTMGEVVEAVRRAMWQPVYRDLED